MEQKGLLQTCDRCGKMNFLKYIGKGETDGGYTRWDKFEESPKGWAYERVADVRRTLCPECSKKWNDIGKKFMDEVEL